jgi:hypothetical protein
MCNGKGVLRRIKRTCQYCGNLFETNQPRAKYCSAECQRKQYAIIHYRQLKERKYNTSTVNNYHICKNCKRHYIPIKKEFNTFCSRECSYQYRSKNRKETRRSCKKCGRLFKSKWREYHKNGYCSHSCSLSIRICEYCGKEYNPKTIKSKYCSIECGLEANKKQHREQYISHETYYEKICTICGKKYISTDNKSKYCSIYCRNKIRIMIHNTKKRGNKYLLYEGVNYELIYQRDKGICHICGSRVHKKFNRKDKLSGTMDHLIPLSRGGSHIYENVKLAHWICNIRRGAKPIWYQPSLLVTLEAGYGLRGLPAGGK